MAIGLSEEQRHALEAGQPVRLQEGQQTYYIISAEQFEKMKMLLEVEQTDPSLYEAGEIHLNGQQWEAFDVGNNDDFAREVERTGKNKRLIKSLAARRKSGKAKGIPLVEVKRQLGLD